MYPLLDYFNLFDDAEEMLYNNISDDSQVVWLHVSEVFELRTDGSKWLPYYVGSFTEVHQLLEP